MHWLGLQGMPRRIPDYPSAFAGWNLICSLGSYVSLISMIVFFAVVAEAYIVARPAPANPWAQGDEGRPTVVYSLEWLLSSPMEFHTSSELPVIRSPKRLIS